jgi:hypothetical protein
LFGFIHVELSPICKPLMGCDTKGQACEYQLNPWSYPGLIETSRVLKYARQSDSGHVEIAPDSLYEIPRAALAGLEVSSSDADIDTVSTAAKLAGKQRLISLTFLSSS